MIKKILGFIADQNKFAPPEDELSNLIRCIYNSSDEIDESMLDQVTAAKLDVNKIPYDEHRGYLAINHRYEEKHHGK